MLLEHFVSHYSISFNANHLVGEFSYLSKEPSFLLNSILFQLRVFSQIKIIRLLQSDYFITFSLHPPPHRLQAQLALDIQVSSCVFLCIHEIYLWLLISAASLRFIRAASPRRFIGAALLRFIRAASPRRFKWGCLTEKIH